MPLQYDEPQKPEAQEPDKSTYSLEQIIDEAEQKVGLPKGFLRALQKNESPRGHFDEMAGGRVSTSPTGPRGAFQFTKKTAQDIGINQDDPYENVYGAAIYAKRNYDKLKSQFDDDADAWAATAAAHNRGIGAVEKMIRNRKLSPEGSDGYTDTKSYVDQFYKHWADNIDNSASPASTGANETIPATSDELSGANPQQPVVAEKKPEDGDVLRSNTTAYSSKEEAQKAGVQTSFERLPTIQNVEEPILQENETAGAKLASSASRLGSPYSNTHPTAINRRITASVYGRVGEIPSEGQVVDAIADQLTPGGSSVTKKYRLETGRELFNPRGLKPQFQQATDAITGEAAADGNYVAPIDIPNSIVRLFNSYATGGLQGAQVEGQKISQELKDADAAAQASKNSYLGAVERGVATGLTGIGEASSNAENALDLGLNAPLGPNVGGEKDLSGFDVRRAASNEELDQAKQDIPQETNLARSLVSGTAAGITELPAYMMDPTGGHLYQLAKDAEKPVGEALYDQVPLFAGNVAGRAVGEKLAGSSELTKRAGQFAAGGAGMAVPDVAYSLATTGKLPSAEQLAQDVVTGGVLTQLHGNEKTPGERAAKQAAEIEAPKPKTPAESPVAEPIGAAKQAAGQTNIRVTRGDEKAPTGAEKLADEVIQQRTNGRQQYNRSGIGQSDLSRELDVKFSDWYDKAKHEPNSPEVKKSYNALKSELGTQFEAMQKSGLNIEVVPDNGSASSGYTPEKMLEDIKDNKHLFVLSSRDVFGTGDNTDHPLYSESPYKDSKGQPMLWNDVFRAVHDTLQHGPSGTDFSGPGEFNAFRVGAQSVSPEALPALLTETQGQSSWVNAGAHVRRPDGSIPKPGDADYKAASVFPEQKATVPPPELVKQWRAEVASKTPEAVASPINPTESKTSVSVSQTGRFPKQEKVVKPETQYRDEALLGKKRVEILSEDKVNGKPRLRVQVEGEAGQRFVSPKELTGRKKVAVAEPTRPIAAENPSYRVTRDETITDKLDGEGRTKPGQDTISVDGLNVKVDEVQKEAYRRLQQTYGDTVQKINRMDISEDAKRTRIEEAKDKFKTLRKAIVTTKAIDSERAKGDGWLATKTTNIKEAFGTKRNVNDVDPNLKTPEKLKAFTPVKLPNGKTATVIGSAGAGRVRVRLDETTSRGQHNEAVIRKESLEVIKVPSRSNTNVSMTESRGLKVEASETKEPKKTETKNKKSVGRRKSKEEAAGVQVVSSNGDELPKSKRYVQRKDGDVLPVLSASKAKNGGYNVTVKGSNGETFSFNTEKSGSSFVGDDVAETAGQLIEQHPGYRKNDLASSVDSQRAAAEPEGYRPLADSLGRKVSRGVKTEQEVKDTVEKGNFAVVSGIHGDYGNRGANDTDALMHAMLDHGLKVNDASGMYQGESEPSFFVKIDKPEDFNIIKRLGTEFGQSQVMFGRNGEFTAPFTNGPDIGTETHGRNLEMDFESPDAGYTVVHLDNGKDVSFSVHDLFDASRKETPLPSSVRSSIPFEKTSLPDVVVHNADKFQNGSMHSEAADGTIYMSPELQQHIADNSIGIFNPGIKYDGAALDKNKTQRLMAFLGRAKAKLREGVKGDDAKAASLRQRNEALAKAHDDLMSTIKGTEVSNVVVIRPESSVNKLISARAHEMIHTEQLRQGGGELRVFERENTAKRFLELPGVSKWIQAVKHTHYADLDGNYAASEIAAHYLSGEWSHLGVSDDVMIDAYLDFVSTMALVEGKGDKVAELAKHALVNIDNYETQSPTTQDRTTGETESAGGALANNENAGQGRTAEASQEGSRVAEATAAGDRVGDELALTSYRDIDPLSIYHTPLTSEKRKIEEVANELESRTKKHFGEEPDTSRRRLNRAAAIAASEIKYQLAEERMGKDSGRNWYKDDVDKMESGLKKVYPELEDKNQMSIFKTLVAFTSGAAKPHENLQLASEVWEATDGLKNPLPDKKPNGTAWGLRPAVTKVATKRIQKLIAEKGVEGTSQWLLSKHPVRELKQWNPGVTGKLDSTKEGMYAFGPKYGAFGLNLHGISQEVTVDQWLMRTWRRWMGTVASMEKIQTGSLSAAPSNQERTEIKQSINRVIDDIHKENGTKLNPSEAQAMLWYYEQELWRKHGAQNQSQSYSGAVAKLQQRKAEGVQSSLFGEAGAENGEGRPDALLGGVRQGDEQGPQAEQELASGRQTFTQRQQENKNLADFDRDTWLDTVLDQTVDGVLPAKKQTEFDTLIKDAQTAKASGNDKETRKAAKSLIKFYGDVNPSRLPDLVNHTARAAMLLGIQVAERNSISNGLYNTAEAISRYGDYGIDWALYAAGYNKQHESASLGALAKSDLLAITRGIGKGILEGGKDLLQSKTSKLLNEDGLERSVTAKRKLLSPLAGIANIGYSLTGAQDKPFREAARERATNDLIDIATRSLPKNQRAAAKQAMLQNLPPSIADRAEVMSEVAVFQQSNKLNDKYQRELSRLDRTAIGRGVKAALNWIQPFVKTNLNIGNSVFDYMGLRPVFQYMVSDEAQKFRANRNEKRDSGLNFEKASRQAWQELPAEQRQAVQKAFSRGLIGWGLMLMGSSLYGASKLTPWDDDETQAYRNNVELSNAGPGHIKLGGYWIDARYAGPIASLILAGGTWAHINHKASKDPENSTSLRAGGTLNVLEKIILESNPFTQTAQELFKDKNNGRIRAVLQPERFVPPLSSEIARLQDRDSVTAVEGKSRDTTGDTEVSRSLNRIKARLPKTPLNPNFNRQSLPTSADVLGRDKADPNPLYPFAPKKVRDDVVTNELGKNDTAITRSLANRDSQGRTTETPTQLRIRQKQEGQAMEDTLRRGINQPGYQGNEKGSLKSLAQEGRSSVKQPKLDSNEKDSNARLIVRSVEAENRTKTILDTHSELTDKQRQEVLNSVKTLFTSAKAKRTPNLHLPKTTSVESDITAQLYSNPQLLKAVVEQYILEAKSFKP
jgi:hypothetical protein